MIDVKGGVQRQSLSSYKDIQDAYSRRKTFLKERFSQPEPTKERDVTLEYLIKKVALLENELARLNSLNDAYKQRFIVWQYNAYMHGVRMTSIDNFPTDSTDLKKLQDMLGKPLIEVKRRTGGQ